MKTKHLIPIAFALMTLQACYKPGEIKVQNNIDRVEILDVKWGDIRVASSLLPGETSDKIDIEKRQETLPSSHTVSFVMMANDKLVYLETVESFSLDEDEEIVIELNDETKVSNSN